MQLSPHFSLFEFVRSDAATRAGLDNTPPLMAVDRLRTLADRLEKVRQLLGDTPLTITSGYRSVAVNRLVGGVANSAHLSGYAADIIHDGFDPLQICKMIAITKDIEFDQVIHEFTWCHFAWGPLPARRQLLTAVKVHGKVQYRAGL